MNNWAIDLTHGNYQDKVLFLEQNADKNVLMDLTCFEPADFYSKYPQLKAVCSTLLSHNKRCEIHSPHHLSEATALLSEQGFTAIPTTILGTGLVVARTLATIINEAYFALEEKVANAGDIDRAMLFGVNYPLGPFAWSKSKEKSVVLLLDQLYQQTKDPRYMASKLLRERA